MGQTGVGSLGLAGGGRFRVSQFASQGKRRGASRQGRLGGGGIPWGGQLLRGAFFREERLGPRPVIVGQYEPENRPAQHEKYGCEQDFPP
jgi:hypothetical protein